MGTGQNSGTRQPQSLVQPEGDRSSGFSGPRRIEPLAEGTRIVGHVFNDDLLANEEDLQHARTLFPNLIHILYNKELISIFNECDKSANLAKRRCRRRGVFAVLLGSFALFGASASPLYHDFSADLIRVIALLSGCAGLMSVVIALAGILSSSAKTEWLKNRLQTERLRQFHFQAFVCRPALLAKSIESCGDLKRYLRERQQWLEFLKTKIRDGEFENLMRDTNDNDVWLYQGHDSDISGVKPEKMKELFDAYSTFRIEHQIRYANTKLSMDNRVSSRVQLGLFENATTIGLVALVAIHTFIAVSIAINSNYVPPELLHVIIIWLAILALAVGTLNEGLRPSREIERYQDYRAAMRGIRDRFNAATSGAAKIEIMKELERLSFYEMRDFLKTHNDAKFIL